MSSMPVCFLSKLPISPAVVGEWGTELDGHKVIKVISLIASILYRDYTQGGMLMDKGTGIDYRVDYHCSYTGYGITDL